MEGRSLNEPECLINFDGRKYSLEVETLHHRFFYGGKEHYHAHPSYHYILVSEGGCTVLFKGHRPLDAPKNSLIFINPLIAHNFIGDATTGVEHTCLIWQFHDENGKPAFFPLQQLLNPEASSHPDFHIIPLSDFDAQNFREKQQAAETAYNSQEKFLTSVRTFELFFLGLNLLPVDRGNMEKVGNTRRIVTLIERTVEQRFMDGEFNVKRLSKIIGLHPNYLNAVYKANTGMTLCAYLTHKRIEAARYMLESSSYNLSEIASMCGFSQLSYFTRIFKKLCGKLPSVYRNEKRSKKP